MFLLTNKDSILEQMDVFAICAIMCLIFINQFIIAISSTSCYLILNWFFLSMLMYSKKSFFFGKKDKYLIVWLLGFCCITFSFLRSSKTLQSLFDIVMILEGLLILFSGLSKNEYYTKCGKIFILFALFHSFGVFFQMLLPDVYASFMKVVPINTEFDKQLALDNAVGMRGFSSNSGFTAGFISVGIITLLANCKKNKSFFIWLIILLGLALLFTAKRGHVLFVFITFFLDYFLASEGRHLLYKSIKILLILGVIALTLFSVDCFVNIPFIREVEKTVSGIQQGKDVSSSRFAIYTWALVLFVRNPMLGIGWGGFRNTTAGNATVEASLDTHNIYLQLLCENGIFIASIIYIAFAVFWLLTRKALKRCIESDNFRGIDYSPIRFSFLYQSFFLLYGLTGNPFFDDFYLILYFFALSIINGYLKVEHCFLYQQQKH